MEQEKLRKRTRDEQDEDQQRNEKKILHHHDHSTKHNGIKKQELVVVDDFFKFTESFQPLGVFEFPWLTENEQIISEGDDLNFDYLFSSSLIDESSSQTLTENAETPLLVEVPGKKLDDEFYPSDDGRGDEINGGDCIWSSVLDQPLFTGSH